MTELQAIGTISLWYAAWCIVTIIAMWRDKRAAIRNQRRVRESTLHTFELLGGWPGAILSQLLFRHKSRKRSYRIVLALIIALHALAWGMYFYWRYR